MKGREFMKKQIELDECRCIVQECLYNIDYSCTKEYHNITPNLNFYNGLNCISKIIFEDKKREYLS